MALMSWTAEYSVGIRSIDAQHRRWLEFINELHEAMREGHGQAAVGKILSDMLDYTRTHFRSEEGLMRLNGYPEYVQHKAIHDQLLAKVSDLERRQANGLLGVTVEVSDVLWTWLTQHIQTVDKRYMEHLKSRDVE